VADTNRTIELLTRDGPGDGAALRLPDMALIETCHKCAAVAGSTDNPEVRRCR
jgi:hypothetical protein